MTIYQGKNVFTGTRSGSGTGTGTTLAWRISETHREPSGVGYNPANQTLFTSNDDRDRIYASRPGADGVHGTADDSVTSFSTATFGSTDPEGVEYDPASGHLFISDGTGIEVYDIDPVNGVFGDVDDSVTHFDVAQYGSRDAEGIGIDPQRNLLLVVDPSTKSIYELTKAGALVRIIDCRGIPGTNRLYAGVTMAPTSEPNDDPSRLNYWIVDRQVDNNSDPNENDGKLYEVSAPAGNTPPPDTPPAVTVTAPSEGATVSGIVTVEASASDDVGVTQVAFSVDGSSIGTDTNGVDGWSASWDTRTALDGAHTITATATDTKGQTQKDSNAVSADNTPPLVAVSSPLAGATVSGTIPVETTASDNQAVASVRFFVDGSSIGTDTSASGGWSVSWNTTTVADGAHKLTATARDGAGNATTSAPVVVTVDNPDTVVLDVPVAVGSDDAHEWSDGTISRTGGDLELGVDSSPTLATTLAVRFTGITAPRGATITRAYVQFVADENGTVATSLTVRAQASDNAATFGTTAFSISSRPRTSASAAWAPPTWTAGSAGAAQRTPDLSSVLQEVVNRPGWAAGNALAVIITGTGRRTAESFEGGPKPILHLEYARP
jgi:Bacterial Ig domain